VFKNLTFFYIIRKIVFNTFSTQQEDKKLKGKPSQVPLFFQILFYVWYTPAILY